MATFTLQTGRTVDKSADYCVAIKANGRWKHQFFKTYKGAQNELRFWRNSSQATRDYYDVTEVQLIKPD
jgi:hypothetical protein